MSPGSPSAHSLSSGDTIPVTQTSTAVQLDQILTSLQAPDRANLQKLLEGYGTALTHKPSAADDATQDPEVQGLTAAQAINKSFAYGADRRPGLGDRRTRPCSGTAPHDLSNLIAGAGEDLRRAHGHESQLQGLVSNFNTVTGALASESANLQRTIKLLGPTLQIAEPVAPPHQRHPALPADLRPGPDPRASRELPATIAASQPWLDQTARSARSRASSASWPTSCAWPARDRPRRPTTGAGLFSQIGLTSGCVDNVLLPASDVVLSDSGTGYNFNTGVPNFKEFGYATAGLAGESASFDGNGPYLRFLSAGGPVPRRRPGAEPPGLDPRRQPRPRRVLGGQHGDPDRHAPGGLRDAALPHRRRLSEQPDPRPERAGGRAGPAGPGPVPMKRALRAHLRDVLAILGTGPRRPLRGHRDPGQPAGQPAQLGAADRRPTSSTSRPTSPPRRP